ncbi:MAG: hypothetical protein FWF66_00300 [Candidatus Bathyarchaeota archaeon]|nr:hypothetical protein [Candidatus Termiticorpusculum sp.]
MITTFELTTAKSIVHIILKGSSKAEISWGDGTRDIYKPSENPVKFNHSYGLHTVAYKIVITGEDISYLFCNNNELTGLVGKSELTKLVGKSELTKLVDKNELVQLVDKSELTLSCGDNKLTDLSVAGFSNIISLDCRNNQLSGKALDSLFDTLPKISDNSKMWGELFIEGNLGVESCNINIATEKGWKIDYNPNKFMSLVTSENDVLFALEGMGTVLVDWGDGKSEPYRLPTKCSHSYTNFIRPIDALRPIKEDLLHDISVIRINKTFSVTHVNCDYNQLISLEIYEQQLYSIVSLSCKGNHLTNLSVAGLTNLTELDCRNNQLSAKALNLLFDSLPKVFSGRLFIEGNSGVKSCNINIATEKGWKVDYNPTKMSLVTAKKGEVTLVCGGAGSVLVNWGDGTNDNCDDVTPEHRFIHTYDSSDEHIITIIGDTITSLDCSYNELKSLDVSENSILEELWCDNNQLKNLAVNNINLKTLECSKNGISELDTSRLTKLTTLRCSVNLLSFIDVSNNLALETLLCDDNKLTHLVVCGFANLHTLSCKNNSLTLLYCYNNQLTRLDFSGNHELETLHCGGNKLRSLDVKDIEKLRFLNCGNNDLASLMLMEGAVPLLPMIEQLYCYGNKIKYLYVKACEKLKIVNCANNSLEILYCLHNYVEGISDPVVVSLDASNNTSLRMIFCCCNSQLSNLDISGCINLTYIQAHANNISKLDVSKMVKLTALSCYHNNLANLDVSNNTELELLGCHDNKQITAIDISRL